MICGFHFARRWLVVALLVAATAAGVVAAPAPAKAASTPAKTKTELNRLLASGDAARRNARPAEALMWYRQAALAGSAEATHRAATLLLAGQTSAQPRQSVSRDVPEGVRCLFWSATNMYPAACRDMARIYREGVGVKTNLVQAYAWLRLFSELDSSSGAAELDKLAPYLDVPHLLEAQSLAGQFKNREWPPMPCKKAIEGDARLTLSGLSVGARGALAVINHRTLAEGETAELPITNGRLTVTCCEIRDQSVLVDIAGENEARLLNFR